MKKALWGCDQCEKQLDTEPRYLVEIHDREARFDMPDHKKGEFCSRECLSEWCEKSIKLMGLYPHYDVCDTDVDNLSTDLWGGAGPDCRTMPVLAGN